MTREDVPWLLIDYLEENIVYGDINHKHSEPSPKRQKTSHPTATSVTRGRSRLRKLPSRPDIMMEDTQQTLGTKQESTSITPTGTIRRGRGRPPRVETSAVDNTAKRTRGRHQKSLPSSQPSTPEESRQSLEAAESGMEPGREQREPTPQPEALPSELESLHEELPSFSQSEASFPQQTTPVIQSCGQSRYSSEMDIDNVVEEHPIQIQEPVSSLLQPQPPPSPPPDPIPSPAHHRLVAPVAPMGMGPFNS
jgi:hypothetical protein